MKIVINKCLGGFGVSNTALEKYQELSGNGNVCLYDIGRADPLLVQVVEELGEDANSNYSKLRVVEVPDNIDWYVHDYDGMETIHESHRSWG
jgi:hypothetical protein